MVDVVIVCHTEFGFVDKKEIIFEKKAICGVKNGVTNLIRIADKHAVKITFAVMPEVVDYFPQNIAHEIGLHVHPGWVKYACGTHEWHGGDQYLLEHCETSLNSVALRNYPHDEQLELIKTGRDLLQDRLRVDPKIFVAGMWSENNDTIRSLVSTGFTHDCTPPTRRKASYFDWSRLPRICMPYRPSEDDYQAKGDLPLLFVPISQMYPFGNVNPEIAPLVGLSWLKACFSEHYEQNLPLFHVCLHSPSMTDSYFVSVMDEFLRFISSHRVTFRFSSQVREHEDVRPRTRITPYLQAFNWNLARTGLKWMEIMHLRD